MKIVVVRSFRTVDTLNPIGPSVARCGLTLGHVRFRRGAVWHFLAVSWKPCLLFCLVTVPKLRLYPPTRITVRGRSSVFVYD